MAIVKFGWRKGFRGRQQPARADRRMHYLASEHGRDSACLLDPAGKELAIDEAIACLGGKGVSYHEVIIAGSDSECETIRLRRPDDQKIAIREAGLRIAHAYAHGRPFVLAIHEGDGRFHYHIAVACPAQGQVVGRNGALQKVWDREYLGDESRIQDWEAHKRFLNLKAQIQQVIRQQQENHRNRREAINRAEPGHKVDAARPYELKSRELIERRFNLETAALDARYEARGTRGGPRHRSEQEQVEHRRTGALNRLERRDADRRLRSIGNAVDRGFTAGERMTSRAIASVGQTSRMAMDQAMRELGVPRPLRASARFTLTLATEASRLALKMAMEATKAAVRSSLHLTRGTATLAIGALAAPLTGGASLAKALPQAGLDLTAAGREASRGLARTGNAAVQAGERVASAASREALPFEARQMSDLARGNVTGLVARRLPEPLRRAMQLARILPAGSPLTVAFRMAMEAAKSTHEISRAGLEVDR